MIPYRIIATGSSGNAVILDDTVLLDCGVSFRMLEPFYQKVKLVLLTHIHGDHFRKATIRKLAKDRPSLRFGCCSWLAGPLAEAGVCKENIDVYDSNVLYGYGICNVIAVPLTHNVPNCGYKVHFPKGKVFYATDTNHLDGIFARNYDLYLVEANYDEKEIRERIAAKKAAGEYAYERKVIKNHLSLQKCNDFIYRNIGPHGEYIYMHCHKDGDAT